MAGRATQHKGCGFQVIRSLGCVEGISNGTAYQSGAKKKQTINESCVQNLTTRDQIRKV